MENAFCKFGVGLLIIFGTCVAPSWATPVPSTENCMEQWLSAIGIDSASTDSYVDLFKQEDVTQSILEQFTLAQLEMLGIASFGHQVLIFNSIHNGVLPCGRGGSCDLSGDRKDFACSCLEGFSGMECEEVTSCGAEVCQNGGECTEEVGGVVSCECPRGLTGDWCQNDVCQPQPCQNGGTCFHSDQTLGYSCSCSVGYAGPNCEIAHWQRTLYSTVAKVLGLEGKIAAQNEKVANYHGPHFFAKSAELTGLAEVAQVKLFSIEDEKYIAVLSTDILSLYQLSSSATNGLVLAQRISVVNATALQAFEIDGDYFIAVACSEGGKSFLFKWNTMGRNFELLQEFTTQQAKDVGFVHIENRGKFLAFSCNGGSSSLVYLWLPTQNRFDHYQFLPTVNATQLRFVSSDSSTLLTIASNNGSMGMIFIWNGTYFVTFQELSPSPTCCGDFYTFAVKNFIFTVSISQTESESLIYRVEANGLTQHSTIPTHRDSELQYMSIHGQHFLAVSSSRQDGGDTRIYRLSGAIFELYQVLSSFSGVQSMDFVSCGESEYLTVANSETIAVYMWQ